MDKFKQTLVNSSSLSFVLVIPAMVGIIVLSDPIIQILSKGVTLMLSLQLSHQEY